jgi:hypothetical protein
MVGCGSCVLERKRDVGGLDCGILVPLTRVSECTCRYAISSYCSFECGQQNVPKAIQDSLFNLVLGRSTGDDRRK